MNLKILINPPGNDCKLLFVCDISALISHYAVAAAISHTLAHLLKDLQCHDLQTLILDVVRSVLISLFLYPCFNLGAVCATKVHHNLDEVIVSICIATPQCQTLTGKGPNILKNLQEHLPVGRLLLFMLLAKYLTNITLDLSG